MSAKLGCTTHCTTAMLTYSTPNPQHRNPIASTRRAGDSLPRERVKEARKRPLSSLLPQVMIAAAVLCLAVFAMGQMPSDWEAAYLQGSLLYSPVRSASSDSYVVVAVFFSFFLWSCCGGVYLDGHTLISIETSHNCTVA